MKDKFEVIVVGGGLAGLTAAHLLAGSGFEVMVLERGNHCGEKNVSGGVCCGESFQDVFGDLASDAPIERHIKRKILACVCGHSVVSYDYCNGQPGEDLGFSVLRGKFDRWLGEKVVEAGADMLCGVAVDDVVFDNGIAKGISVNGERLYADVVILAEGANALLTEKIGFRTKLRPYQMGLGVREAIRLGETTINDRFNLDPGEGTAIELFGTFTEQIEGGGFLYTNKDTISLGLVFTLASYSEEHSPPYDILEYFKSIPYVAKLIEGGETVEYSAHMVPEVGLEMLPTIYGNGILVVGDAAGFTLKNGRNVEGMNYAIESGKLAAETVIKAVQFGDYSAETLSEYERSIRRNSLFKRLMKYKETYKFFQNPRLYKEYPELVANFSKTLFGDGDYPDSRILGLLLQTAKSADLTVGNMVSDMVRSQKLL
ncbi:FAD-dependent oxidoreductase [Verrucomicrobiota bacterium]